MQKIASSNMIAVYAKHLDDNDIWTAAVATWLKPRKGTPIA